jgi:hypothetical protein
MHDDTAPARPRGRAVVTRAAWSLPVILAATAVPSGAPTTGATITAASFVGQCHQSGKSWGFSFTLKSTIALTITGVASGTVGYDVSTNNENLSYFSGANRVVGMLPGTAGWQLAANGMAIVTVPVDSDADPWPGSEAEANAHGTQAFSLLFTAVDSQNTSRIVMVTFAAGYDLPGVGDQVTGRCPPGSAPMPGGKEWCGSAAITAWIS